jgi:ribosomal protein L37AE/L43A
MKCRICDAPKLADDPNVKLETDFCTQCGNYVCPGCQTECLSRKSIGIALCTFCDKQIEYIETHKLIESSGLPKTMNVNVSAVDYPISGKSFGVMNQIFKKDIIQIDTSNHPFFCPRCKKYVCLICLNQNTYYQKYQYEKSLQCIDCLLSICKIRGEPVSDVSKCRNHLQKN